MDFESYADLSFVDSIEDALETLPESPAVSFSNNVHGVWRGSDQTADVVVAAVAYKRRDLVAIKVGGCPNDKNITSKTLIAIGGSCTLLKSVDASRTAAVADQWPG